MSVVDGLFSLTGDLKILTGSPNRDIPLVLVAYVGYKLIRRTKVISLKAVAVRQALEEAYNDPENFPIKTSGWSRLNILWG